MKIDATQAQGLKRTKEFKADRIKDLVDLLIAQENCIATGDEMKFQIIESALSKALYSKETLRLFWDNLELLVSERLSGMMRVKRQYFPDSKEDWFSNPPTDFEPSHLSQNCYKRLESMISTLYAGSQIPYSNQNIGDAVVEYKDRNSGKMIEFVWDPRIWLCKEEVEENLKFFTIIVISIVYHFIVF